MSTTFSGEQIAQVNDPDPFAVPVWRSPVYHTPGCLITTVLLLRAIKAVIKFLARHPVMTLTVAVLGGRGASWDGPARCWSSS